MTMMTMNLVGAARPHFETLWGKTISRDECYVRYEYLAKLEEDLLDQGKALSDSDSQELKNLVKLVAKDQSSILRGRKTIEIGQKKYYYVQFHDPKVLQLEKTSNAIKRYLEINSLTKMVEAFEKTDWYRKSVIRHVTVDHMDAITALRSSHQFNMDALQIVKRLESLHVDIMTADIYPAFQAIFTKIFELYGAQKQFNDACSKQILCMIQHYDKLFDREQEFVKEIFPIENAVAKKLAQLEADFKEQCSSIIKLTDRAFNKATQELDRTVQSVPDKVFMASLVATSEKLRACMIKSCVVFDQDKLFETADPTYRNRFSKDVRSSLDRNSKDSPDVEQQIKQIEASCSQAAVWVIEKVDKRMLNSAKHVFTSISHSVKQIQSTWKAKFSGLDRKLPTFRSFLRGIDDSNRHDFRERCLSGLSFLHTICIQSMLHSKEIHEICQREREVFDRQPFRMQAVQSVFIQNSLSGKYLMCQEAEVAGASGMRHADSEVFLIPPQQLNDRAIWHLAKGEHEGSIIISNMVSKRYLVHSHEFVHLGTQSGTKVMGNPLTHIKDKSSRREPDSKSILESTQIYEGLWKFIKIHDLISEAMRDRPKKLVLDQVMPFSGNGGTLTIHIPAK